MTAFERKICEAFFVRFKGDRLSMRLRSISIFPDFETSSPDDKASYLDAAEALEQKGLISLKWEKYREGDRLKTLTCLDMEKLFAAAGSKDPKAESAEISAMIQRALPAFEKIMLDESAHGDPKDHAASFNGAAISFLHYLLDNFGSADVGRGMDLKAAEDLVSLLDFLLQKNFSDGAQRSSALSSRALSVKLFNDSKRLERILDLASPLFIRAKKQGHHVPDLSSLERSFPETFIAGKLIFEYDDKSEKEQTPPLLNSGGLIIGLPFSSVSKLAAVRLIERKNSPKVLTVENKETFYALASSLSSYDCFLYTGGYPNRAAGTLIKTLAASGFSFYHAGDLDPDGILILQNIRELAEKPVTPINMDAATFDRYLAHARPLNETTLRQAAKIHDDIRAIPGIVELLRRILETGKGVEQEVVEYG